MRLIIDASVSSQRSARARRPLGRTRPAEAAQTYTLSMRSQLVVETVVVKDKQGKPIEGLTAKDFTITEDGVPQKIRFCEHQALPASPLPIPPTPSKDEALKIYKRLARTQIAPERQGSTGYKDRRLLALYFDMSAMPPGDQLRALRAAEKFIRTQMTAADLVCDPALPGRLGGCAAGLHGGPQSAAEHSGDDGRGRRAGLGGSRRRCEQRGYGRGVRAGRQRVQHLQYRSPAFRAADRGEDAGAIEREEGADLLRERAAAERHRQPGAAACDDRCGDPRGCFVLADRCARAGCGGAAGRCDAGIAGQCGHVFGRRRRRRTTSNFQQSQDTLFALAGDTGGKALLDNNDLTRGIVQAQQAISSYYMLEYYTTNTALDGQVSGA